jgi:hypothetical protein
MWLMLSMFFSASDVRKWEREIEIAVKDLKF